MTGMMSAAVYIGSRTVVPEQVAVPVLNRGELLVRVYACGICGTDLKKIHYGLVDPPRIFGHETAGVITAVGEGVQQWSVGDRVSLNHHVPCMQPDCFYCNRSVFAQCPVYKRTGNTAGFEPAGGGFAQYVRVMDWCAERGTVRIPDDVSFLEATFVEPLNTCLKGVRMAGILPGDTVLIVGQGPIGLLFTMLVTLFGARVVATDMHADRRREAVARGATVALNPLMDGYAAALRSEIESLSDRRGADVAIIAVPDTRVVRQAFEVVRPAGKVLLFAQTRLDDPVEVDAGGICMQEKALIGSYSSDVTLQQEAADLIFSRRIDVRGLVSHQFPLDRISEAIDIASRPRDNSLKVVVTP